MAIIRITKEQIEKANKAHEAALLKDHDFRKHEEKMQRVRREAAALREKAVPAREKTTSPCEEAAAAREEAAAARNSEQRS